MRYFNTHGPVEIDKHYVVSRQELVEKLKTQIDQGKYLNIHAPRQMGKTTLLRRLDEVLEADPAYLSIPLNFELYEHWSESEFLSDFGKLISRHLRASFKQIQHPQSEQIQKLLDETTPVDYAELSDLFSELYEIAPEHQVVLIIDEFDATPQEALSPLLQTWRSMYLESRLRSIFVR